MFDPTTAYVVLVLFIAAVVRSAFGFGQALVAVPLLALQIHTAVAAPLAVLSSALVGAVLLAQDWRLIELRPTIWLFASSLLGIPLGMFLLDVVDDSIVKCILGLVIAAFAAYSLTARRWHLEKDHPLWLLAAGFSSGILGGAYGMNGPPLIVYGTLRRWSPQQFRAMLQGFFLPAGVISMVGYATIGLWTAEVNRYFLLSLPATIAAMLIGHWLHHRFAGEAFFRYVYFGLIAIGVLLVAEALH